MGAWTVAVEGAPAPVPLVQAQLQVDARWRGIVQDNFAPIWRFLWRLGVPAEMLDDTAQQVFLVALTRASDIIQGKERSFLFSTAVRVAAIARRKRRIDHERSPELPELLSDTLDPEQLADQKEALETLENVVAALPEDLRAVFVLFELEGLTTPEIAAAMGIRVGTAASRLRRAREEFHAIIKRERARQGTP